jgi:hypothetical protein
MSPASHIFLHAAGSCDGQGKERAFFTGADGGAGDAGSAGGEGTVAGSVGGAAAWSGAFPPEHAELAQISPTNTTQFRMPHRKPGSHRRKHRRSPPLARGGEQPVSKWDREASTGECVTKGRHGSGPHAYDTSLTNATIACTQHSDCPQHHVLVPWSCQKDDRGPPGFRTCRPSKK